MKTIDDVTREDVIELAEAAIEILPMARFHFWYRGGDLKQSQGDAEEWAILENLATALATIGLPQMTYEEFKNNIEDMLRSGLAPDQWRKSKGLPEIG